MKVGSRVRTTAASSVSYSGPVGTEGTIISYEEGLLFPYTVVFDFEPEHEDAFWLMALDEIEEIV